MRLVKLEGLAGPVYVHPDAVLSITPARGGTTSWVTVRTAGDMGQPLVVKGTPDAIFERLRKADEYE